jgi:6,7-dimethyl-8-ribityllumazine synthase
MTQQHESWPSQQPDMAKVEARVEDGEIEAAEGYDHEEQTADAELEAELAGEVAADRAEAEEEAGAEAEAEPVVPQLRLAGQHAAGALEIPDDVDLLEGDPSAWRRGVGIVVSRFNGELTNRLLESALGELERFGVGRESLTVMAVPGAFELPLGAMALAKTRRFACIVALGCVIRGETAHFEYVAGEAASGLQLAALETGVPVAFGVLTVDTAEQAEARIDKGAEAVRTALEMADLFRRLRATAQAAK